MTKTKIAASHNSQVTFEALQALIAAPFIAALEKGPTLRISDIKVCIPNNGALEEEEII